jgi:hypothetical protein
MKNNYKVRTNSTPRSSMKRRKKETEKKEDDSIDFLEVHIPAIKEKMQDELEKKLLQLRHHVDRLTGGLRRFLDSR